MFPSTAQGTAGMLLLARALPAALGALAAQLSQEEITIKWSVSASLYHNPGKSFGTCWLLSAEFDGRSQRYLLFAPHFVPAGASSICSPTSLPSLKGKRYQTLEILEVLGRAAEEQTLLAVFTLKLL